MELGGIGSYGATITVYPWGYNVGYTVDSTYTVTCSNLGAIPMTKTIGSRHRAFCRYYLYGSYPHDVYPLG